MPGRRSPDDDDAASVATSAESDTVEAPRPALAGVRVKFMLSSDGVFKVRLHSLSWVSARLITSPLCAGNGGRFRAG